MERVFPVTEKSCAAYCGKPVFIYLYDGSEIYGVLSRVENGHLILNDKAATVTSSQSKKRKSVAVKSRKKEEQAETKAFHDVYPGPLSFGGFAYNEALALPLASTAFLFAIV
ncbi:hypothetical protein [Paenibacillus hexagrammi]|uniref:Uncharacterized protein n=1 Tax=Paenibacillus hexagrammi TaxID=2908839 RepID=A0ABY3SGV3_9BACL|nr:hypothetical protein [Paenibacillus sp. YPD9-1]UJF32409.1 hypothetical protein L0M14_22350 [Paenibacillus sp. YPD9-1]